MKTYKISLGLLFVFIFFLAINLFRVDTVSASGISADAGLTPAANRWIFRTQFRAMKRDNHPTMTQNEMKTNMYPIVIAYGLKSNFTLMIRQAVIKKEMSMIGQTNSFSGLGDLLIMSKYRLIRINNAKYTLGIAPTFGLELPTGKDNVTSNSYDLHIGTYISGRARRLSMDMNFTYIVNGLAKTTDDGFSIGNQFSVISALGYQFSLGSEGNFSLTPVMESSYLKIVSDSQDGISVTNSGESLFFVSPGFKITWSSYIFESLIQFPIWQNQNGLQTERTPSLLVGIRLMN